MNPIDAVSWKRAMSMSATPGGAVGCTFSAWIRPVRPENSVNGMIIMTLGKWFNNNHNSYADFNVNANGQMI